MFYWSLFDLLLLLVFFYHFSGYCAVCPPSIYSFKFVFPSFLFRIMLIGKLLPLFMQLLYNWLQLAVVFNISNNLGVQFNIEHQIISNGLHNKPIETLELQFHDWQCHYKLRNYSPFRSTRSILVFVGFVWVCIFQIIAFVPSCLYYYLCLFPGDLFLSNFIRLVWSALVSSKFTIYMHKFREIINLDCNYLLVFAINGTKNIKIMIDKPTAEQRPIRLSNLKIRRTISEISY